MNSPARSVLLRLDGAEGHVDWNVVYQHIRQDEMEVGRSRPPALSSYRVTEGRDEAYQKSR